MTLTPEDLDQIEGRFRKVMDERNAKASVQAATDSETDIIEGPNADGAVRYRGSLRYTRNWFLDPEMLKRTDVQLNEQQRRNIMWNCGCDEFGNIGTIERTFRIKKNTMLVTPCYRTAPVTSVGGFTRWPETTTSLPNTIASRYPSTDALLDALDAGALK